MSDTTTAEDRCRGVLVGLAAGDRNGGPIRMAVRLAESLIECGGFNAADILNRYLAWWHEGAFDTGPVSESVLALIATGMSPQDAVGKGEESFLSLPVVARGSIPPIYRRALFGHRATPWPVPLARRHVGSTAGGTRASDKKTKPRRRKCVHRNRRLSVCHFRLNFMARTRIRNHASKTRNRVRQLENEVAK